MDNDIARVLYSKADIKEACERLGKQLTKDYAGKRPLILSVLTGAMFLSLIHI